MYERLRSAGWMGGRVVRRGRAARDGSNGSVREREGVCGGGGGGGACGGATRRMAVARVRVCTQQPRQ
jgi:hypothetical protein